MKQPAKLMERSQSDFKSSQIKSSQISLPPLHKNQTNKTSTFASGSKLSSSQVSQFSKGNFIGYENKSYENKIGQKVRIITRDQYQSLQTGAIYKEYTILKQELRKMGEQLNRVISSKNFSKKINGPSSQKTALMKSMSIDESQYPKAFQTIQQGFQRNNSKIIQNNSMQLNRIMQNSAHILQKDPLALKQQLRDKILSARQELQKEKKKYKHLMLQSEKVGNDILNTDNLIQEIRSLENQLNIFLLRKRKLQQQADVNRLNREKVDGGTASIYEKEYELEEFQSTKRKNYLQFKTQEELGIEASKRKRKIAALTRDKDARNKIKAKHYYDLLSQINKIEENQQTINLRYDKLQKLIQQKNRQFTEVQLKYSSSRYESTKGRLFKPISNITDNKNGQRNSFYKSKRNLDVNQVRPKDMQKEVEEDLSRTHKKLEEIQRQKSPKRNLGNEKIRYTQFQDQVSAFQIDKQNEPQSSNLPPYRKKSGGLKVMKPSNSKKYEQLSDSQILEQQQEQVLEQSTNKQADEVFEGINLAQNNLEIDEEIQA